MTGEVTGGKFNMSNAKTEIDWIIYDAKSKPASNQVGVACFGFWGFGLRLAGDMRCIEQRKSPNQTWLWPIFL